MRMEELVIKLLGGTVLASGSMVVALSQTALPIAPQAKGPMEWAFMTVVGVVVFGAAWVVKFTLSKNAKREGDMSEAISKLAEALKEKNKR